MTSLTPEPFKKQQQERDQKRAAGYLLLGECPANLDEALRARVVALATEALAARLIWDEASPVASVRERGIHDAGQRFFVLGDSWALAHDFYIKPGMLDALLDSLDGKH